MNMLSGRLFWCFFGVLMRTLCSSFYNSILIYHKKNTYNAYPIVTMFCAVTLLSTAFKMTYSGIDDLIHEIVTYKKGVRFAHSYLKIPSWP